MLRRLSSFCPTEVSLSVAGKTLLMVHGSPESVDEHIYHDTPETRLKELVEDAKVDLICGSFS